MTSNLDDELLTLEQKSQLKVFKQELVKKGKDFLGDHDELAENIKSGSKQLIDYVNCEMEQNDRIKQVVAKGSGYYKDFKNEMTGDEKMQQIMDEGRLLLSDVLKDDDTSILVQKTADLFKDAGNSSSVNKGISEGLSYIKDIHDSLLAPNMDAVIGSEQLSNLRGDAALLYGRLSAAGDDDTDQSVSELTSNLKNDFNKFEMKDVISANKAQLTGQSLDWLKHMRETNAHKELVQKGIKYVDKLSNEGVDNVVDNLVHHSKELLGNKEKRDEMIEEIKNKAVDYLMEVIPKIKAPPISGTHDDYLKYHISNVDFTGFIVSSSSVHVKLDFAEAIKSTGVIDEESSILPQSIKLALKIENMRFSLTQVAWKVDKITWPRMGSEGLMNCSTNSADFNVEFILDNLNYTSETISTNTALALSKPRVSIKNLDIKFESSSLSWLYNTLAKLFEGMLIDAIEKTAVATLVDKSNELLTPINEIVIQYLPLLKNLADKHFKDLSVLNQLTAPSPIESTDPPQCSL